MATQLTLEDLLVQLMSGGMDLAGIPLGDQLVQLALPTVKSMVPGIDENDILWKTVVMSDATRTGDALKQQLQASTLAGQQTTKTAMDAAMQSWFKDWARTLHPKDKYDAGAHSGMSYDEYISMVAQNQAGNFIWRGLYNVADPGGYNQMGRNLASAYSNMTAEHAAAGDYGAYAKASGILKNLYMDNGRFAFDTRDYGGIDAGGVGYLTAEVAKSEDFLKGLVDDASIKGAAERMRNKVKGLANSLAPLKDVFGNDIPKMIEDVESLTGQAVGNLEPGRLRRLSETLTTRVMSGKYDLTDVKVNQMQFAQLAQAIGIQSPSRLHTMEQAMRALDVTKGGTALNFMTEAEQQQNATSRVFGAQNSGQADALNKAYAIWNMNTGGSMNRFMETIRSIDRSGIDPLRAAMQLAGVHTTTELDRGMAYAGYRAANEAGLGGDIAMDRNIAMRRRGSVNMLSSSMALREATGLTGVNNGQMRQIINAAIQRVEWDPSLANMNLYQRMQTLENRGMKAVQAEQMSRIIEYMRTSSPETLADAALVHDKNKQTQMDRRASATRAMIEQLTGNNTAPGTPGAALTQYIKTGGTASIDAVASAIGRAVAGTGADERLLRDVATAMYSNGDARAEARIKGVYAADSKEAETVRQDEMKKASENIDFALTDPRAINSQPIQDAQKAMGITSAKQDAAEDIELVREQKGDLSGLTDEQKARLKAAGYNVDSADAARENLVIAKRDEKLLQKYGKGNLEQDKRRYAATVELVKNYNADSIENFMRSDNKGAASRMAEVAKSLSEGAKAGSNESIYYSGLQKLLNAGGETTDLSSKEKEQLEKYGYSMDPSAAAENMRKAKTDILDRKMKQEGSAEGIKNDLFAANTANVISQIGGTNKEVLAKGMKSYEAWRKKEGKDTSAASFNEWLETKDEGGAYKNEKERLVSVFNQSVQATGMNQAGNTNSSGLLGTVIGKLTSILVELSGINENTKYGNPKAQPPRAHHE